MIRFGLACFAVAALGLVFFPACGGDDGGTGTACEAGAEVFCRCQGGVEGTKTCQDDGSSFGECTTVDGPCPEIPETTSSGQGGSTGSGEACRPGQVFDCTCEDGTAGTQTCEDGETLGACSTVDGPCGSGATTSASTGTGGGGERRLYEPCGDAADCASAHCEMGFCTKECGNYAECIDEAGVQGECARFAGGSLQVCAPYCSVQTDCLEAYGEPSACGFGVAPDDPGYGFTVCGDWGAELIPLAEGLPCEEDVDCNLAIPGAERVCSFQTCVAGCYQDFDCPAQELCDSDGSVLGNCF